jgi:hypothetical protein
MACKFIVNSAIQARLLRPSRHVQPSPQRALSFRTVYEPRRPNHGQLRFPLILSSRSYSESTPTSPPPKDSGSTKGSQSSEREDKNWLPPRVWIVTTLVGTGLVGAGSIYKSFEIYWSLQSVIAYVTQESWTGWYKENQRRVHESARQSAIYNKLKEGPKFWKEIKGVILRKELVDDVKKLIAPTAGSGLYHLIIGEHGTGKTSLIQLAVDDLKEPKGVIYVDMPLRCDLEVHIAKAVQQALGWMPDQVIDSGECNYSSSLLVGITWG